MTSIVTNNENLHATEQIAKHPIHPMPVSIPIAFFVGALLTDITYYATTEMMWAEFSSWLLAGGIIAGVLAAIAGLIHFLSNRLIRTQAPAWPHLIGNFLVLALAFFNNLVHTRDAWTSVVPTGIILSAITVPSNPPPNQ